MKRHRNTSPPSPGHKKANTVVPEHDEKDGEQWTKVMSRKEKKRKKMDDNLSTYPPRFMYNNADIVKRTHAISIDDLRELMLHIVADAPQPGWLKIENVKAIDKVVAVLVPGITGPLLSLPPLPTSATSNPNVPIAIPLPSADSGTSNIPFITSTFSHACPTRAPGDQWRMFSVLSSFFQGPINAQEKKRRLASMGHLTIDLDGNVVVGHAIVDDKNPARYTLSLESMIDNEYPIPSYMADVFEKPPGWIETPDAPKESLLSAEDQPTKIYALDCEMCETEDGKELARVCVIDYHTELVVYDQLVKPAKPVLDYLTRWSGITAEALDPITTTLAEVQSHLLPLLSSTSFSSIPILLGHSLESDLQALKLCHPRCIDTAVIYHHPRGRPLKPGLAWLTRKWCGREIQTRGDSGHDPEEDAKACLELLKKKVANGPGFGEFKTDRESIFERISRAAANGSRTAVRCAVVDLGNPALMHGAKATTTVSCKSDNEVIDGMLQAIPSHQFVFGRFMALADALGWITPKPIGDGTPVVLTEPLSPEALTDIYVALNTRLQTLHNALPPRTALLIFTGHSDPRRMASLGARKSAFENAVRGGKKPEELDKDMWWTMSDGRELEEAVELTKRGLMFLCIKQ